MFIDAASVIMLYISKQLELLSLRIIFGPFDQETNFKEWKQVVQEIVRFLKVDTAFMNIRPLRYCLLFDSHPSSVPRGARFQARNLKLQDALLTSYRRNEVSCFACL